MDIDLDMLRVRGRSEREVGCEVVREIEEADLVRLEGEGRSEPGRLKRLSERHHAAARHMASGISLFEISVMTGYTAPHLSILKNDPSFRELVSFYKEKADALYADMHTRLAGLSVDAIDELRERLEEDPKSIGTAALMEMTKMGADRTGHGPSSTNIQINTGMAQRLEAARRRVNEKMIDITPDKKEDAA